MCEFKPDVVETQLLLNLPGEEESGAGVSAQAVGHDEHQRAASGPHKAPV